MDIKNELIIDNEFSPTDEIYHLKCGEVIVSSNRNFMLRCSICRINYKTFKKFMEHITNSHSFTDFDENLYPIDSYMVDQDENFCEAEIEVTNDGNTFQIEMEPPADSVNYDYSNGGNRKMLPSFARIAINNNNLDGFVDESDSHISIIKNEPVSTPPPTPPPPYTTSSTRQLQEITQMNFITPKVPKTRNRCIDESLKRFSCKLCDKCYPYSSSLSKHMKRSHGKINASPKDIFVCTKCDKKCTTLNQLTVHDRRSHCETNKIFQCSACPPELRVAFKTKKQLAEHGLRLHAIGNKFKCRVCFSGFNFKKDLMNHEQTVHLDQRPYVCLICSFAFKERKHLTRHERKHTGEKPYSCDYCHERFTRMDKKKAHLQKKH